MQQWRRRHAFNCDREWFGGGGEFAIFKFAMHINSTFALIKHPAQFDIYPQKNNLLEFYKIYIFKTMQQTPERE